MKKTVRQLWVSTQDASKILGVHNLTIIRYINRGLLKYKKIGNRIYIEKSQLMPEKEGVETKKAVNLLEQVDGQAQL